MSIRQQFYKALLRLLTRHVRLANHPKFGTDLYILPLEWETTMQIRLTLSWVEGHHVMSLGYWFVLRIFLQYCKRLHPIEYKRKEQGYILYLNHL